MNSKTRGNTARKIKENLRITGMYAFLVVICVVIIYPILWIVFSSFNPSQSMFSSTLIPKEMSLSNYVWLFTSPRDGQNGQGNGQGSGGAGSLADKLNKIAQSINKQGKDTSNGTHESVANPNKAKNAGAQSKVSASASQGGSGNGAGGSGARHAGRA